MATKRRTNIQAGVRTSTYLFVK